MCYQEISSYNKYLSTRKCNLKNFNATVCSYLASWKCVFLFHADHVNISNHKICHTVSLRKSNCVKNKALHLP